jgi:hypothetical protein
MNTKRGEKVILKQDALGRVSHTAEQREALLDEFERSGMKGLPFARMAGVNYQTFASWIQKRRRARGDYARREASPGRQGKGGKGGLRLVEVRMPAAGIMPTARTVASIPTAAASLEVRLCCGASLRVADEAGAVLAAHLLRHLQLSTTTSTTSACLC